MGIPNLSDNPNNSGRANGISPSSDSAASKSNQIQVPQISLPKGGGALKNIDEKFEVNSANGTSSFSIPIPMSKSRSDFMPSLGLSYNSGAGNSEFGLGWSLALSSIQRKTDKQLPKYLDADESDTFMFSGVEDLVPKLNKENDKWEEVLKVKDGFEIKQYIPRIEGSFHKIERIKPVNQNTFYWKVTSRNNTVTFFGLTDNARLMDPDDKEKIFKWFPELSYDNKGNCFQYEYKNEDAVNIQNEVNERNHLNNLASFTNVYLKKVKYGNKNPYYNKSKPLSPDLPDNPEYFFEVVFDYGEHTHDTSPYDAVSNWDCRYDAFSDYHSCFEIRTYRLCKRVLLFHTFKELNDEISPAPYLVKSLDLHYKYFENESDSPPDIRNAEVELLQSVESVSYKKNLSGVYEKKSLPKIEFTYHELIWNNEVKNISSENIVNAPAGITSGYQWMDFYGEGISGIFTEQADGWFYKSNLGNGNFSSAEKISTKPSFNGMSNGSLQMQDLDADGRKFVVSNQPGIQGYFEMDEDEESNWKPFKHFDNVPNVNIREPKTKFIDLNGDGKAELVVDEDNVFVWYPSLGTAGYDSPELFHKPFDDEEGPRIIFSDSEQSIFLADLNGDGMTDIARIRNRNISYWANMGYGKFSPKITMNYSPVFDSDEDFNPEYLYLFDISGTGSTDIVYAGKNKLQAWINLSGNSWSEGYEISNFPTLEKPNDLSVVDLLGNGTGCIAWSSPLPSNKEMPMRYIDLMGGKKPYILCNYKNGMGKITSVEYTSSTQYYLEDKASGNPWITKLPFPVQCVSKLVVEDEITGMRFTNEYSYHHGYYDYTEREFRGFGRVEQTDTEVFDEYSCDGKADLNQPPVVTKTWFHTGAFLNREKILTQFEEDVDEYFKFDNRNKLPSPVLDDNWSAQEWREALRACKGMVLRQEVYSYDNSDKAGIPYSVAEHNCNIQMFQPTEKNKHAVFTVQESEAVSYSFERNISDPRISHTMNIEIDELGNILKSVAIVYGRRIEDDSIYNKVKTEVKTEQEKINIIYSVNVYTNDINDDNSYRLRMPYENITYELYLPNDVPLWSFFTFEDVSNYLAAIIEEIPYESSLNRSDIQKRKIEHQRILYLKNDTVTQLPAKEIDSLGLVYESYQLAFTNSLIADLFVTRVDGTMISEAGYKNLDKSDEWWIRSGTVVYKTPPEDNFYLPEKYIDPLGSETNVFYYDDYNLFINKTEDAVHNITQVESFDFRTLSPQKMIDMNDVISELAFDILGLPVGMCIRGKHGEGDNLDLFNADLSQDEIRNFFDDPVDSAFDLLGNATSRFIYDFTRTNTLTSVVSTITRETHSYKLVDGNLVKNDDNKVQMGFEYSDGFGKVVMKKVQAEPGLAKKFNEVDCTVEEVVANPRWVGNGRTIFNNKGKPVKQFEPYFSTDHKYEDEDKLVQIGVTPVMYYDPLGRLIKTEMPDGTFSKVEFDQWHTKTYDANDTVLMKTIDENGIELEHTKWYLDRINGGMGDDEKEAAEKAAIHAETHSTDYLDSLGRNICNVAHNVFNDRTTGVRIEQYYPSLITLDIEGNQRKLRDAKRIDLELEDVFVMEYKYDMLGKLAYQKSMDAGERWMFNDCMQKPFYKWDSKETVFKFSYDDIHRPVKVEVTEKDKVAIVSSLIEYGESIAGMDYMRGKVYRTYDTAGIIINEKYDFKGNPLNVKRQLCEEYKQMIDWTIIDDVELIKDEFNNIKDFETSTEFDALNRPVKMISPDDSVFTPLYNQASMLESVNVKIRGATDHGFVKNINYNEKGQRTQIEYGNNVITSYEYDEKTFRIKQILTKRNGTDTLQDLNYTYDPVGNITRIIDKAQDTIYFNNSVVKANGDYTYDAIYRLIKAEGRENVGGNLPVDEYDNFRKFNILPGDGNAMQNYRQYYEYDEVGNMKKMIHSAGKGVFTNQWTREFLYENNNNRLKTTQTGSDLLPLTYGFDIHGNMTSMPHLESLTWNLFDQLSSIVKATSNTNTDFNTAYYVYDGGGNRVRKVITHGNGVTEDRIYLGTLEYYTKKTSVSTLIKRETLHVMDDKKKIAMVDTKTNDDDVAEETLIRYQLDNHLGTACVEVDDKAEIISYEEYYPFGSTAYQVTRSDTEVPAKRYRYTGKERDEESGLYYHGARHYAPWLARWTACDPKWLFGIQYGFYTYCFNNPIMFFDNNGLSPEDSEEVVRQARMIQLETRGLKYGSELRIIVTDPVTGETHETRSDLTYKLEGEITWEGDESGNVQLRETRETAVFEENKKGSITKLRASQEGVSQAIQKGGQVTVTGDKGGTTLPRGLQPEISYWGFSNRETLAAHAEAHGTGPVNLPEARARAEMKPGGSAEEAGEKLARSRMLKSGRLFASAVFVSGWAISHSSAAYSASQGDLEGAALDEFGNVPIVGDLLDVARGSLEAGRALDSYFGVGVISQEYGMRALVVLNYYGIEGDTAAYLSATLTAVSTPDALIRSIDRKFRNTGEAVASENEVGDLQQYEPLRIRRY